MRSDRAWRSWTSSFSLHFGLVQIVYCFFDYRVVVYLSADEWSNKMPTWSPETAPCKVCDN